jgi:hypothetical protein
LDSDREDLKPHQIAARAVESARIRRDLRRGPQSQSTVRGKLPDRLIRGWSLEDDEGRDLAHDSIVLPGDEFRLRRTPSLERQDAFHDETTTKRKRCDVCEQPHPDLVADDAALYRLGILYDEDPYARGSGFSINAIARSEPTYSVNYRPLKRGRKAKAGLLRESLGREYALPLNLSFSALEDDETIARYLISPDDAELSPEDLYATTSLTSRFATCQDSTLRVVYSVEADASTHFPVMFSNSLNTNTANAPFLNEFVDLLSDPDDNYSDDDEEEEWEVVQDTTAAAENNIGRHNRDALGGSNTAADTNPDVWVVLG